MSNEDKKWIKWIVIYTVIGLVIGLVIKHLLLWLIPSIPEIILSFIVPGVIIIALFLVLYRYNREKEKLMM